MSYGTLSDFVSFPFFGFTLVINSKSFNFQSDQSTFIFFDYKRYNVIFEYGPWKNILFCFISIFWVQYS